MGNWAITIIGTGAHHNENYEGDANKIFKKTVDELKAAGQNVEHASFTHGGREVEKPNFESYYPPLECGNKKFTRRAYGKEKDTCNSLT